MKTPQEWVDAYAKGLPDSGFVNATEMIKKWVSTIQQDAFESGRVAGLNEAGELCQSHEQTKTEYMIRLHNVLYGDKIKITPPATKSDVEVQK